MAVIPSGNRTSRAIITLTMEVGKPASAISVSINGLSFLAKRTTNTKAIGKIRALISTF